METRGKKHLHIFTKEKGSVRTECVTINYNYMHANQTISLVQRPVLLLVYHWSTTTLQECVLYVTINAISEHCILLSLHGQTSGALLLAIIASYG